MSLADAERRAQPAGRAPLWPVLLLAALSVPIVFYRLGSYGLVNGDEGVYHAIAREMARTGRWWELVFTGERQVYVTFLNAPLQYWARAVLIAAFGDSYWTMRGLSAAFALLSVVATYRLAAFVAGARAGLVAGLVQLTTFQFVYMHSARTGELEPIVCFVLTATALLFLRAIESGRSFVPHHLCLVALLNLKTPLVLVPLAAELAYFATAPAARPRLRAWAIAGLLLPVGLAWHVAQLVALGPQALEALATMAGEASGAVWYRAGFLGNLAYYGWVMLFGALPWVVLYPFAILGGAAARAAPRERAARRLMLFNLAALFTFFAAIAKTYYWYIDPAYPFLSAFVALWLERLWTRRGRTLEWIPVAVCGALLAWIAALPWNPLHETAIDMTWNPSLPRSLVAWRGPADVPAAVGLPLTAGLLLAGAWALRRRLGSRATPALAAALAGLCLGLGALRVLWPLQFTDQVSRTEALAREIAALRARGERPRFPVVIRDPEMQRVRYFFGDDYEIVWRPDVFVLVGEGQTPRNPLLAE